VTADLDVDTVDELCAVQQLLLDARLELALYRACFQCGFLCENCWCPFERGLIDQRFCDDSCRTAKYRDVLRQDLHYRVQQMWNVLPAETSTAAGGPITDLMDAINRTLWAG
jgi:hypothetical protein